MLHIHFSNRPERLVNKLVAELARSSNDLFTRDQIVVPSAAHRRALTLAITDHDGVCANVDFSFLAQWLWRQAGQMLTVQAESPFDTEALAWRVYEALRDRAFVQGFPRLASYVNAGGADELMRYEFARSVAAQLEQYLTYRPEWLTRWRGASAGSGSEFGPDEAWQAALWQRIAGELQVSVAHPLEVLIAKLAAAGATVARDAGLPERVHVFGLNSVPPLYLAALKQLSRCIDVCLYLLNPCREYWHDVVGPRELSRLEARGQQGFEVGQRLLASWGQQTQAHLSMLLEESEGAGAQSHDDYEEAGGNSLLAQVQDAILNLTEIEPGSMEYIEGDRSLEVHVCHSMTRELEVLQDHLLGLFATHPGLRPCDVLVVTPDLPAVAPLIEAVFGTAPARRRIPYETTGLGRGSVNRPAQALIALLTLASSRCLATQLQGVLQQEVVARRFGFDEAGLQQVHEWLLASGVHWALDEGHLDDEQLPAARHTLASGLERLFLAYALPDDSQEVFDGLLSAGDVEGTAALQLGALEEFSRELQTLRRGLTDVRLPAQWRSFLHQIADRFIEPADDELEDMLELHGCLDEVADGMERGGVHQPVASIVVRKALEAALEDTARGGVPTGRVTFTGMSTLRGLAYKVICAIGINDGAFPRQNRPSEFDLMAGRPKLGDRQRSVDQRNVFLDLLLAARSMLYLSYTGRSIRDNAVLPPSVLVSELLDVVVPGIARDAGDKHSLDEARRRIVVEHPLQPFSAVAFSEGTDPRLRSFDEELAQALRESAAKGSPLGTATAVETFPAESDEDADDDNALSAVPFFTARLDAAGPEWREVRLEQLIEFYRDPSRYLLRRRMGLELAWDEEGLADDEPFLPNVPARTALAKRLLPMLLSGAGASRALTLATAGTEFPEGTVGRAELESEVASMDRFAGAIRSHVRDAAAPPHQASVVTRIEDEDWTVYGGFADLRGQGRVRWRYDDERAADVLQAWIEHVFLCAAPPPQGSAPVSQSLARDAVRTFEPLEPAAAKAHLDGLVANYCRGLREPLRFFPKSAWKLVNGTDAKARDAWNGNQFYPGEKNKISYRLAFRGDPDPLAGDFEEIAKAVFEPALACSSIQPLAPEVKT